MHGKKVAKKKNTVVIKLYVLSDNGVFMIYKVIFRR